MAPQAVLEVCGAVPESRIKSIFTTCMSNNFDALTALGEDLLAEGYPVSQAYSSMPTMLTMLTVRPTLTARPTLTMLTARTMAVY